MNDMGVTNMKIIKDNYNNTVAISGTIVCERCDSVFEFDQYDLKYDYDNDIGYVVCPCCKFKNDVEEIKERELSVDNVSYPYDYYDFSNGKNVDNNEINDNVRETIHWLMENPDEPFKFVAFGNTLICVFNKLEEDEYDVIVTKNYQETYIPKEN